MSFGFPPKKDPMNLENTEFSRRQYKIGVTAGDTALPTASPVSLQRGEPKFQAPVVHPAEGELAPD